MACPFQHLFRYNPNEKSVVATSMSWIGGGKALLDELDGDDVAPAMLENDVNDSLLDSRAERKLPP